MHHRLVPHRTPPTQLTQNSLTHHTLPSAHPTPALTPTYTNLLIGTLHLDATVGGQLHLHTLVLFTASVCRLKGEGECRQGEGEGECRQGRGRESAGRGWEDCVSHHHFSPMKDSIWRPKTHHFDCELVYVWAHVLLKQPQVVLHALLLAHDLVRPPLALQEAKVVLQAFLGPGYPLEDAL